EQLLVSGHGDAGLEVRRTVLRSVGLGLAPTPRRALLSLVWRRAALRLRGLTFRQRSAADIGAREVTRIDTCWAVAAGLALVDNIRAADFLARHLQLALRAGEPYRVARGFALQAGFTAIQGRTGRRRAAQLLAVARPLAERIQSQHALALCELAATVAAFYEGRWEHARGFAERAEQMLLECGGVPWELNTAQLYQMFACYFLGDVPELARLSRTFLSSARERGIAWLASTAAPGSPTRCGSRQTTWRARSGTSRRPCGNGIRKSSASRTTGRSSRAATSGCIAGNGSSRGTASCGPGRASPLQYCCASKVSGSTCTICALAVR